MNTAKTNTVDSCLTLTRDLVCAAGFLTGVCLDEVAFFDDGGTITSGSISDRSDRGEDKASSYLEKNRI